MKMSGIRRRKKRDPQNCTICGAPDAQINHGGLTCISCRSFFVRCARSVKTFKCIGGGNCPIITGRESYCCKACRYQKCLEAGMNIELVPTFMKKDGTYTKFTENLIQRHVVPAISLGYKFVATASNTMNAIKCAQFYSSLDKVIKLRDGLSEQCLKPFTLRVPLAHAILDTTFCYAKHEAGLRLWGKKAIFQSLELPPEQAMSMVVAHNYVRCLVDVIDFATAIPEFLLLPQIDRMRLIQKSYFTMVAVRCINEVYFDPAPSPVEGLIQQICAISTHTAEQLQMFGVFLQQRVLPTFNELQVTQEEGILLLLIACFTPLLHCSDEGRASIRQARNKYVNVLKNYHHEKLLDMSDEDKIKRFRLLLEFIAHLQEFANHISTSFTSQILNNADSMLGVLSYDMVARIFND